ncbi:TonB-dependent receptor [Pontibacter diazotrophicus]|uniref:TonB-dependent receptor n=1 Tax=Pontibacter diazotrophicus TaxID=1400979 RepID=A0A3D8LBF8_9BACT|nr:TonB-dependent receptor [Pontibacter diazotrophicus]RDV14738.1 TonB-dependent receptor [Pontibacter diazotrophicus]
MKSCSSIIYKTATGLRINSIKSLFAILLFFAFAPASAQDNYRLSGRVVDALTGEGLAGASVSLQERISIGAITETNGSFSLTAPAGTYTVVAKYIGYDDAKQVLELDQNRQVNIKLAPTAYGVKEVEVVAERQQPITQTATLGQLELPMETIKTLPVLFGELDILKTIQLLPGVQSGGEGNTGFYVRGGGADQNLVLLDNAVVYNPGHLLNFFSVFNSDAIANTTLIKGNMPARYGGRLSSVLDIEMREGDMSDFSAEGGIGLISSRLTVQGPIVEDKASFIFSGRRTYIDAILNPFLKNTEQGGVPFRFYDLNGKLTYALSAKDKLTLSGYYGRDIGDLRLSDGRFTSEFSWGNATATARWNHQFSDKLFMDVSGVFSNYQFEFNWDFGGYNTVLQTGVEDYSLNVDFDFTPNVRHHLQYGVQYTYHTLRPRTGEAEGEDGETFGTSQVLPKYAHETALYVSDDWNVTDKLLVSLGLRSSHFMQVGPFSYYHFNENNMVTDSTRYGSGEKVKSFQALEPRASARYTLSDQSSVKTGFARSAQYLHLVSNAYTTLPLDVWVPSSAIVEPQRATQYALGYFRSFAQNQYEGSVEVYYKDLENQLEYREGFAPGPSNRDLEYEFVSGSGESYGVELFMRKNYGDLQGWVGYTLSKTTRQFPELNNSREFPARFDRRHDLSLVGSYKYNNRWTFGGSFIFGTGQATTLPLRRYYLEGTINYQYGDRNSFRMQPTHRLDLSATLEGKDRERIKSNWTFSIYNVYGRRNPFLYYVDNEGSLSNQNLKLQAKKVSIIPFPLPSVTWNFIWK